MEDLLERNFMTDPQPKDNLCVGPWGTQEEPTIKNDEMVIKLPKTGPGQSITVSINIIPSAEHTNTVKFDDSARSPVVASSYTSAYNLGMGTYTPNTFSTSMPMPMFGGIAMNKTSTIFHSITNSISWGATVVFGTLFFSGAVFAPVTAASGLVCGLIASIGLTYDTYSRSF